MGPVEQAAVGKQPSLTAVVTDVLGGLAFLVSDSEPASAPPGAIWLGAEITYSGSRRGTLRCRCTRDFAIQLAANLLGIEPDESDARLAAEDALREFMNVLCGQLVTAWFGTADTFTLSIPTAAECGDPGDWGDECRLCISGEPFYCAHDVLPAA